ncbi:MAG: hypothetical protein IJ237_05480 [Oscillospiraceae bacterium]|nr:hypothetical protein [Oscillospiraceae bacterium]
MDVGYAILMFCFALALVLYGVLLMTTKNISLIPQAEKAKIKDKKTYAKQFGKAVALLALAPATSGLIWLTGAVRRSVVFLVLGFLVCVWEGTEMMSKVQD